MHLVIKKESNAFFFHFTVIWGHTVNFGESNSSMSIYNKVIDSLIILYTNILSDKSISFI